MSLPNPPPGQFRTTQWSLVASARSADPQVARQALDELCRIYWSPLYAFLRRRGFDADTAMDTVQGFVTQLLTHGDVDGADLQRGRFRSYLLGALKHFVLNEQRAANTQKRGGGQAILALDHDPSVAEGRYLGGTVATDSPEDAFDREFALALLDRSLARVRQEYTARGRAAVFDRLRRYLAQAPPAGDYAKASAELGLSETSVKVTVHRMRGRLRMTLTEELAQTLDDPAEVDAELGDLLAALGK